MSGYSESAGSPARGASRSRAANDRSSHLQAGVADPGHRSVPTKYPWPTAISGNGHRRSDRTNTGHWVDGPRAASGAGAEFRSQASRQEAWDGYKAIRLG